MLPAQVQSILQPGCALLHAAVSAYVTPVASVTCVQTTETVDLVAAVLSILRKLDACLCRNGWRP